MATLVAVLATVALRVIGHESWQTAFAVALALLGVRVAVMAWCVVRRELPWPRLLLPGIILLEAVGLSWRGSAVLWQVRLGTAVMLELAFIVVAVRELRRTTAGDDPLEARIARALDALLPPRVARLVAFELVIVGAALRFLIGGWRRRIPDGFTYHRESNLRLLLPIIPLLAVGDILLLELVFLPHAATWLRVVVHGLAIYGLIWLVGLYASLRARPHTLADGRLMLHRGILGRVAVPVAQLESIDGLPSFADDWKKRAYCKDAIRIDIAGPTILELRLRAPVRPIGVLGERAAGTRLLVAVDDPAAFRAALGAKPQLQSL
ncbi:MAG TPA: hypothetical protein VIV11_39925 [Kofleriaceae bacterium]